jgi:hypothetical protein
MVAAGSQPRCALEWSIDMDLSQFIYVGELSTGRRLFVMRRMQPLVAARGHEDMVVHIAEGIAHELQTRELDLVWSQVRAGTLSAPNVGPVDVRVDHGITALRDAAEAQARGAAPGDPVHGQVAGFLGEALPVGVYAVTSLPYVEQLNALEILVDKLQGPLLTQVMELGIVRQSLRLAELLPLYRDVIHGAADGNTGLDFATVRAARQRGQRYLYEIIAMILGRYYRADDPEHQAARAELLGPMVEQNEAVRSYLRARRAVRDVDPDTGEPLPETDEPATGEPAASQPAA